jgi:hypothetical protein
MSESKIRKIYTVAEIEAQAIAKSDDSREFLSSKAMRRNRLEVARFFCVRLKSNFKYPKCSLRLENVIACRVSFRVARIQ